MALNSGIGLNPAVLKEIPANILTSVRTAAQRTGVNFSYLVAKAAAESSFNPHAQASTSSARGLYQFLDNTWIDMIKEHGAAYGLGKLASELDAGNPGARAKALALRDNPTISAAMAAEYTRDNQDALESALGRPVGPTDLYLAHFLGAQGATKFLTAMEKNPAARADTLFPAAARANQSIFYADGRPRTVGEIYRRFTQKLDLAPGGPATVTQVADAAPSAAPDVISSDGAAAAGAGGSFWRGLPRFRTFSPPPSTATAAAAWASPYSRLSQDAILLLGSLKPPESGKIHDQAV
ncbi:MAG TPA: transglycosylase SLT domain-containing protein [Alphaproteobacteria bacterium]|nr:transglycosylase SLT domain-containing protein [Alphaproteobacteria bacterium]